MKTMSQDFRAAEERALLATADLLAAAHDVIRRHTIRLEEARDDVDFALLSRRWTSYADRKLDESWDAVDFASRARTEVVTISASLNTLAAGREEDAVAAAEEELTGRLVALAAECERRAISLRS